MKNKKLIKILKARNPNQEVLICGKPDFIIHETDYQNVLHIIPKGLVKATFREPVKENKPLEAGEMDGSTYALSGEEKPLWGRSSIHTPEYKKAQVEKNKHMTRITENMKAGK